MEKTTLGVNNICVKSKAASMNKIIAGHFEEWGESPRIEVLDKVKETGEKLYMIVQKSRRKSKRK